MTTGVRGGTGEAEPATGEFAALPSPPPVTPAGAQRRAGVHPPPFRPCGGIGGWIPDQVRDDYRGARMTTGVRGSTGEAEPATGEFAPLASPPPVTPAGAQRRAGVQPPPFQPCGGIGGWIPDQVRDDYRGSRMTTGGPGRCRGGRASNRGVRAPCITAPCHPGRSAAQSRGPSSAVSALRRERRLDPGSSPG